MYNATEASGNHHPPPQLPTPAVNSRSSPGQTHLCVPMTYHHRVCCKSNNQPRARHSSGVTAAHVPSAAARTAPLTPCLTCCCHERTPSCTIKRGTRGTRRSGRLGQFSSLAPVMPSSSKTQFNSRANTNVGQALGLGPSIPLR